MSKLPTISFWLFKSGIFFYLLVSLPATAQIVPDSTLLNKSNVTTDGSTSTITGGTQAGSNLFHSFEQFSIPTGGTAYFNNTTDIQNIFSRVTGSSISNIDGLIKANGTANVFLLNPNGIIFGDNASLNIGGSFVASTASNVKFANGSEFNAGASQSTPLLTVSVPVGLGFGSKPGSIEVQGNSQGTRQTSALMDTSVGLRVQPDRTLGLVGGDVVLEGGTLKTAGGRIELGSVADSNFVSLTPVAKGWSLGYEGIQNFQDIYLSQQAAVDASGTGAGDIQVQGRQVKLTDGSQIESSTLGSKPGGTLAVIAKDSVELLGTAVDNQQIPSALIASIYSRATGNGGNITIKTGKLSVRDGAQIGTDTSTSASAGSIAVNAKDSVELSGTTADGRFASGLFARVQPQATGNGGNITVETGKLSVRDGAQITATTAGNSSAGNIAVNAKDSVELSNITTDGRFTSGLFARVQPQATGNGGNITVETGKLSVRDGAQITATTAGKGSAGNIAVNAKDSVELSGTTADGRFASGLSATVQPQATGNGGNITVETGKLSVRDGAQITATTAGKGSAGNIAVNAKDSVELSGATADGRFASGLFVQQANPEVANNGGSLTVETRQLKVSNGAKIAASTRGSGNGGILVVRAADSLELSGKNKQGSSGLFSTTRQGSTGTGGNLNLNTKNLVVRDGAEVNVSSEGTGNAGNLQVQATSIRLDNGRITAATAAGEGGNISLQSRSLQLRNGSSITASAGGSGNGGNITINTGTLAALPNENSDINANAIQGRGGNIRISTQGLFGIQFREQPTSSSDITASSQFGLNGVVDVRVLGFDPRNTLTPFTTAFLPTEKVMEKSCLARQNKQRGKFVVTGGGALAATPNSGISEFPLLGEPETTAQPSIQQQPSPTTPDSTLVASSGVWKVGDPIVEAQGLAIAADGSPVLSVTPSQAKTPNPQDTICR